MSEIIKFPQNPCPKNTPRFARANLHSPKPKILDEDFLERLLFEVHKEEKNMEQLIFNLINLTKDWDEFNLIPKSAQQAIKEIGKEINKLEGFAGMQRAYYIAKRNNRWVSVIQAYWDGIGDWKY